MEEATQFATYTLFESAIRDMNFGVLSINIWRWLNIHVFCWNYFVMCFDPGTGTAREVSIGVKDYGRFITVPELTGPDEDGSFCGQLVKL